LLIRVDIGPGCGIVVLASRTTSQGDDMSGQYTGITYVIPCGAAKADQPTAARDLYTGSMFRHTLAAAEANAAGEDARILILSALHGLVELDVVLAPYEQRMDQPGSITPAELAGQAAALGIDWGSEVYGYLPSAYRNRLDQALKTMDVYLQDIYEATGGIGDQRHVNAVVTAVAAAYS
jgi:hypothetical protein